MAAQKMQKIENNNEKFSKNSEKIDKNADLVSENANNLSVKTEQNLVLNGEILLGEMLKELRINKNNKLLVIFREIQNLKLDNGFVSVVADSKILDMLEDDEAKTYLNNFLKKRGLRLKLQDDEIADAINKLNELVGGNLKIN